jgi:transposase IS116/IS110/IS902 family protein
MDAEIITSFPGLGALTGARVMAELGDDNTRFTDARALDVAVFSLLDDDGTVARTPAPDAHQNGRSTTVNGECSKTR